MLTQPLLKKAALLAFVFLLSAVAKSQLPVVSSFSPTIGGQSSAINIFGSHFTNATAVSFGGTPASFFFVLSDTAIVAFVDEGSSGAVAVTNASGTGSKAGFTFIPPPAITSLSPTSGTYGDTIRIRGQHFINVYDVFFGDSSALSFTVTGDTLIKAVVGNGTSGQVTVSTIGGYGTITDFTYTGPTITSFSPTKGNSGTVVQVRGRRFTNTIAVSFGGFPASSFIINSDSLITATVGAGGPGNVVVNTTRGTASAPGFIVPVIKSFDPPGGTKYTEVTIKGLNFDGITSVTFGDSAALSFSIVSDTMIKAVVGNGESGAVEVSNTAYSSSKDYFFYSPYIPQINSFSPASGSAGTLVTIRGNHFTGASSVSFGNTPAASFSVISDTVITATVSTGSSGYVSVTNNNYTDSLAGFTYNSGSSLQICPLGSTSISSNLTGSSYQWQVSINNGSNFNAISNGTNYSGTTTATLQIINAPSAFNGYVYRCVVNGSNSVQSILRIVNVWTGAVNSFWNNTGNWSCGILPDGNSDVLINNGTVILNANGACRSIRLSPGVNFTANAGFRLTITH